MGTLKDVIESLGDENKALQEGYDASQKHLETSKHKMDELMAEVTNIADVKENLLEELERNRNKFASSLEDLKTQMSHARTQV